jgi:hypothetical protein
LLIVELFIVPPVMFMPPAAFIVLEAGVDLDFGAGSSSRRPGTGFGSLSLTEN